MKDSGADSIRPMPDAAIVVSDIVKDFAVASGRWGTRKEVVHAVNHVSFEVGVGETLGIVGESGSGKSTVARILMGLESLTSGSVTLAGEQLFTNKPGSTRRARRAMQIVFQDPYGSLDPRMTVFQLVSEPWVIHRDAAPTSARTKVAELLTRVGLDPSDMDRVARTFSGGQRQRIGIARALALSPKVLILDEPVSALDVSIQAQIIELLRELQEGLGLAMIFIAHDLAVVRSLAHRVAVMYLGRIVEVGPADAIYERPTHPYTRALLTSIPAFRSDDKVSRIKLQGEIPSPINVPTGCRFHTRCWLREQLANPEICTTVDPSLERTASGQDVACHFSAESPSRAFQLDRVVEPTTSKGRTKVIPPE